MISWGRSLIASAVLLGVFSAFFPSDASASCRELIMIQEVVEINGVPTTVISGRYVFFSNWLFGCL